ncbi:MAG: ATP-grasp domain-containing protein [Thermodesulfobacteriota bacterium]|nr:ATP-grasp domain-containing protein [Thermodesulfobacteriota bacterium]
MKIAVVYNRQSKNVINLFGIPNLEKYGKKAIKRITDGLKKYGHQVTYFEADKDIIEKLEEFMPKVLKNERPGMVFNLSYGIQGQARYTHIPGILEMIGIPYVGSGPLAHSLALDKVVAKMIFLQHGLPTPQFSILDAPYFKAPDLPFPLIVKPKNEAVSMGIKIVNDEQELHNAAKSIHSAFAQPVLVEQYIEGREINVGLIGNNPPEALPPCEIIFGDDGPPIYTMEDKKGKSGRKINWICPAPIEEELMHRAKDIAIQAFSALGCYDSARVDMRLDKDGNLYILEINSLPSLGEHGSYVIAAQQAGLDFAALVNRLVEVASARYFGTPTPPIIKIQDKDPEKLTFSFLTKRRDLIEKQIAEWCSLSSRTYDPVGNSMAIKKLDTVLKEIKMKSVKDFTDTRSACTWETNTGFAGGTLFIGHMDIPFEQNIPTQAFRRDPEWLYGEGIAMSRAPLVMLLFILLALRHNRLLHQLPIGVLYYLDEGRDCRYSADIIREASSKAGRVFVLRPGSPNANVRTQRRGNRKYRLVIEGKPQRIGQHQKSPEVLLWAHDKLAKLSGLSSRKDRIYIGAIDFNTEAFRMSLPHRLRITLVLSYLDIKLADTIEEKMYSILDTKELRWTLDKISDRPPMKKKRINLQLAQLLCTVAQKWDIPLEQESSVAPSVAGLVPLKVPVICGIGPVAQDRYTPQERVLRISIVQRTLLMAEFLAQEIKLKKSSERV